MDHKIKLNERTEYSIIPDYSIVVQQGKNTVILTSEDIATLFIKVTKQPDGWDAQRDGCQG